MPGFKSLREIVDAEISGNGRFSTWRKTPTQTTGAGIWFDLSMSPGNPSPQYYAASPAVAIAISASTDGGLFHGASVSPKKKYLRKCMALTVTPAAVPLPMILMDYLLYYPFIDESLDGEAQILDNTVSLPRYTDGSGVQVMAVVVAGHAVGGQTFSINYTNSDGVSNRVSPEVRINTQFVNGTLITTAQATNLCAGPFLPLQAGDSGVSSIQSVTMTGSDVGLFTLVLVKPLATISLRGIDAPVEVDFFKDSGATIPEIKDNAYLNFICCPNGTLSGAPFHGYIETAVG